MTDNIENPLVKPTWKRRWFRIISISGITLIIILAIIPAIISSNLKSWLLENGADNVTIQNVDFNPFTGTAAVYGLDVRIADKPVISNSLVYLNISLLTLIKKGIGIQSAILKEVLIDIEQYEDGKIRIGSLSIDPNKKTNEEIKDEVKEEIAWWLNLGMVTLDKCVIQIKTPKLTANLYLDDVTLQDLSTRPGEQSAILDLQARINESAINGKIYLEQLTPEVKTNGEISVDELKLNEFAGLTTGILDTLSGIVDLSGKFSVAVNKTHDTDIRYTGSMLVSNADVSNKDFVLSGKETKWDGSVSFVQNSAESNQGLKVDGKFDASGYTVKLPEIETSGTETSWQGQIEYANKGTSASQNISLAGDLDAKELMFVLAAQNLAVQQQQISINPQLKLQITEEKTGLTGSTDIQASGTIIKDTAKSLTLVSINKLDVSGATAESLQQATIKNITIVDTGLLQKQNSKEPAIAIDETTITDFNYVHQGMNIQTVALGKLSGSFVREKDGSIDVSNDSKAAKSADNETDSEAETDSKAEKSQAQKMSTEVTVQEPADSPFGIKISSLVIKDSSTIRFTDMMVSPTFNVVLDINSLEFKDIDNSKPEQPITIDLNGKLDNYATLSIKGSAKPFLAQPGIDLKIDLEHLNMVGLSPYVISNTGYLINSGQLQVDSKIVINDGSIDAKNTLFMKKLKMKQADANIAKDHAGSIGMPLDKALGMLRDKNDNIKLEIPITGKLDEVNVGINQIINTALKKATTAGMKTYLLYAFQPYGAMILAGQAVGNQLGKIKLDPVFYEAGESALTNKHKDYLKKLGKVMQDRPKIDVQICAFTTISDLSLRKEDAKEKDSNELTENQVKKSLTLGQERQKIIKDYLISEFKIDDGRLILCAPEHDKDKDAKPRVELLI